MKLEPKAAEGEYYFAMVAEDDLMALTGILESVVCIFRESEGLTIVFSEDAKEEVAELTGKEIMGPFALITMTAQTELNAIGILAKITDALAKEKIAVNAFSAYYHDHILVPYGKKERATAILESLSVQ
ncbi:MAG: ACT domain-containing protein [Candidatus Micrarchaeota archaeon]